MMASLIRAERDRLIAERRRTAFNAWLQGLRDRADVVDNRRRFFF
jgi:hypothetical protein